jgi:hypothetical protein
LIKKVKNHNITCYFNRTLKKRACEENCMQIKGNVGRVLI